MTTELYTEWGIREKTYIAKADILPDQEIELRHMYTFNIGGDSFSFDIPLLGQVTISTPQEIVNTGLAVTIVIINGDEQTEDTIILLPGQEYGYVIFEEVMPNLLNSDPVGHLVFIRD